MTGHAARLLKAMGALAALLAVVVGVPVLMTMLQLVPDSLPSLDEVGAVLTSRDNGQFAGLVLAAGVWVCWALFTASTMAEIVAFARARPVPALHGLGFFQRPAAALVTAVAVGFTVAPPAADGPSPGHRDDRRGRHGGTRRHPVGPLGGGHRQRAHLATSLGAQPGTQPARRRHLHRPVADPTGLDAEHPRPDQSRDARAQRAGAFSSRAGAAHDRAGTAVRAGPEHHPSGRPNCAGHRCATFARAGFGHQRPEVVSRCGAEQRRAVAREVR